MRSLLCLLAASALAFAQPAAPAPELAVAPAPVRAAPGGPAAELSVGDAVTLGVIEGITEFLPISSTGHLLIATHALGLDSSDQLAGPDGSLLWLERPTAGEPAGEPLTLKSAADTYVVVIQFGAIAAVALLYHRALRSMLRGLAGRDPEGLRLLVNLVLAFLPAAVLGFLFHDWIDAHLFSVNAVIVAQVAGAILMVYAEWWRKRRPVPVDGPATITPAWAFRIGLLQCAALWPGTSRSMMTIVGGYFAGLDPRRAAEFSFLLGFVTLTAAAAYKSLQGGAAMIAVFGWPNVLLGAAVAAVSAALAVRFLVTYLTRHGLLAFAVYRLVTAAALVAWMQFWG